MINSRMKVTKRKYIKKRTLKKTIWFLFLLLSITLLGIRLRPRELLRLLVILLLFYNLKPFEFCFLQNLNLKVLLFAI